MSNGKHTKMQNWMVEFEQDKSDIYEKFKAVEKKFIDAEEMLICKVLGDVLLRKPEIDDFKKVTTIHSPGIKDGYALLFNGIELGIVKRDFNMMLPKPEQRVIIRFTPKVMDLQIQPELKIKY